MVLYSSNYYVQETDPSCSECLPGVWESPPAVSSTLSPWRQEREDEGKINMLPLCQYHENHYRLMEFQPISKGHSNFIASYFLTAPHHGKYEIISFMWILIQKGSLSHMYKYYTNCNFTSVSKKLWTYLYTFFSLQYFGIGGFLLLFPFGLWIKIKVKNHRDRHVSIILGWGLCCT